MDSEAPAPRLPGKEAEGAEGWTEIQEEETYSVFHDLLQHLPDELKFKLLLEGLQSCGPECLTGIEEARDAIIFAASRQNPALLRNIVRWMGADDAGDDEIEGGDDDGAGQMSGSAGASAGSHLAAGMEEDEDEGYDEWPAAEKSAFAEGSGSGRADAGKAASTRDTGAGAGRTGLRRGFLNRAVAVSPTGAAPSSISGVKRKAPDGPSAARHTAEPRISAAVMGGPGLAASAAMPQLAPGMPGPVVPGSLQHIQGFVSAVLGEPSSSAMAGEAALRATDAAGSTAAPFPGMIQTTASASSNAFLDGMSPEEQASVRAARELYSGMQEDGRVELMGDVVSELKGAARAEAEADVMGGGSAGDLSSELAGGGAEHFAETEADSHVDHDGFGLS
jgi:hypothetical protein